MPELDAREVKEIDIMPTKDHMPYRQPAKADKNKSFTHLKWNKWNTITRISDYVVLDVETTGLKPGTDKIIEIGMVKVSDGKPCDEFSSFVNPEMSIPTRITKITGITNEDMATAPVFSSLASQIVSFLGDSLILGHNVGFDLSFLVPALESCGIRPSFTCLDTCALAKKAFPELPNHKLDTLIGALSLSDGQTHRALDDVYCTLGLFNKICEKYPDSPLLNAVYSCCTPIESFSFSPVEQPLAGKQLFLTGTFTFPYSAAKKLISAAGGLVTYNLSDQTDYLVYGFQDTQAEDPARYEAALTTAHEMQTQGHKIQLINEIQLLKTCGVSFY